MEENQTQQVAGQQSAQPVQPTLYPQFPQQQFPQQQFPQQQMPYQIPIQQQMMMYQGMPAQMPQQMPPQINAIPPEQQLEALPEERKVSFIKSFIVTLTLVGVLGGGLYFAYNKYFLEGDTTIVQKTSEPQVYETIVSDQNTIKANPLLGNIIEASEVKEEEKPVEPAPEKPKQKLQR